MSKKYELTNETKIIGGVTLRRIRALKDFANVKKGDLGGWIQSEENLSHDGNCWVYGDALVFMHAKVYGNAHVYGNAMVYINARVFGNAKVYGDTLVFENALVFGNAHVSGNAQVHGDVLVYGNAHIYGTACVYGRDQVYGDALVYDNARIRGNDLVHGDARVFGNAWIVGNADIQDSACITETSDYVVVGPIGSRDDLTTFYRSEKGITVTCGCFKGTLEEFEKKVKETHGSNRYATQYLHAIEFAKNLIRMHDRES